MMNDAESARRADRPVTAKPQNLSFILKSLCPVLF